MAHQVPGPYGHPPVPHWHSPQGSATVTPESPKPLNTLVSWGCCSDTSPWRCPSHPESHGPARSSHGTLMHLQILRGGAAPGGIPAPEFKRSAAGCRARAGSACSAAERPSLPRGSRNCRINNACGRTGRGRKHPLEPAERDAHPIAPIPKTPPGRPPPPAPAWQPWHCASRAPYLGR